MGLPGVNFYSPFSTGFIIYLGYGIRHSNVEKPHSQKSVKDLISKVEVELTHESQL